MAVAESITETGCDCQIFINSRSFIHNPLQGAEYAYYVEIDVTGLDMVYGRDNVFVILNQEPLDLVDRIVSYGKVGD